MKNRNGLVFALCAMLGAAGTLACSNESGDSGLVINPESVSLAAYGTQSVEISGATASTAITVTSGNSACVSVNNADNLLADANGMANFLLAAANTDGKKCDTVITVTADGETKVINASVAEATGDAPTGDFVLTLDPAILEISGVGGEANTKITYKQGETPAGGRTLKVSKVGGEDGCVEFSTSPVTNLNNGTVDFKVKALKDSCNVKLLIEDALPSITGEEKELSVYVGGVTDGKVEGEVKFIEPVDDILNVIYSSGEGKFKVEVIDENSQPLKGTKVTLDNSNKDCVQLKVKSITTDDDGVAEGSVNVKAANCESTLTASAIGKNASITVKVLDQDKFDFNAKVIFDNPRYSEVNYVAASITPQSCADWAEQITDPQGYNENFEPDDAKEGINGVEQPELTTFKFEDIDATKQSILVIGKVNGDIESPILAYGCRDISVADHKKTVDLNLKAVPVELKGEYEVVSNFDIAGAFTKDASTSLPYVEDMKADDWIKFTTDFFKYPVKTLIDFIWVNSIARLSTLVDSENDSVLSKILGLLNDKDLKTLVTSALEPMINDALKDYGWFTTFTTLTPDIEDLVSNMQLGGTMTITDTVFSDEQMKVTEAKISYTNLQYRWSLVNENGTSQCANDIYSKKGECRRIMSLTKGKIHNAAIDGSWTGVTALNDLNQSVLYIDQHDLALKWANILYMAVFGEILPTAMSKYYNSTTVESGMYIKAFLEAILFKPVVGSYETKQDENCDCKGTEANKTCDPKEGVAEDKVKYCQSLKTSDHCERFIEALVYMIADKGADYSGIIATVAGLACDTRLEVGDSPKAIGKLDSLVNESLSGLQVTFKASADACMLDSQATTQVMSMGEPDELAYSAKDVFKNGSTLTSTRCTWNMGITDSHSMNGLFHATRKD